MQGRTVTDQSISWEFVPESMLPLRRSGKAFLRMDLRTRTLSVTSSGLTPIADDTWIDVLRSLLPAEERARAVTLSLTYRPAP